MKNKFILIGLSIVFISSITASFLINKTESKIGNKVILNNDTLTIVDYSLIFETYTLSNDKKISFKLIDKLEKIKHE